MADTSSEKRCPFQKTDTSQSNGRNALSNDIPVLSALADFNREKVPERAVHAKGAGAYGEFEVTADISDICNVDMLLGVGKKTPCVTRFSTTSLERGSADSVRDPKGMATRFFTADGNWDWVCLNIPFFFIRDPMKFPALIHAQRRDPQTNLVNANAYWDWVTENHESLHMIIWQFSDFGSMFSYRNLSSYMGHAYKWVMPDGSFKYVHMFLTTGRGPAFGGKDRVTNSNSVDPDDATRELYEDIEKGDYPTWTANVQVVDPKDAPDFEFNILDMTKHWNLGTYPEEFKKIPQKEFGKLTLTRNPKNYFEEIEQLAFSPSNLVPGVEPSEDPLLQARMFAYPDAQRHRLGPNFQQLPANQHKASKDGRAPGKYREKSVKPQQLGPEFERWISQVSSPSWSQPNEMDYKFARDLYNILPKFRTQEFQDRMVQAIANSVAETHRETRERVYETFNLVLPELANRVRQQAEELVSEQGDAHRSQRL